MFCLFFFFQAEDGIRDLVRSRGLGDVYKRQVDNSSVAPDDMLVVSRNDWGIIDGWRREKPEYWPVSYTHLTLPTIYSV